MKRKVKKFKITVTNSSSGVTIWAEKGKDRRWVLDASTILKDGTFRFDPSRFNICPGHFIEYKEYKFVHNKQKKAK